uniref:Putative secreted protein n=1 Tax=Amblyomma sculptum TaxID=1581419 RepID=A0A1E1XUA7_AMBSC
MAPQLQPAALAAAAAFFLTLATLPSTTTAIECYQCSSALDPECENNPSIEMLKNCSDQSKGSKFTACRKIDENVDFEVNGLPAVKRVVRQCAVEGEPDRPCYYKAGYGGRVNVCHCFEDKCNSASLPAAAASLAVAGVLLALRVA